METFEFTSRFLRGQDLPEGKAISFKAVKNRDGQVWGWRASKGQYGAEVKMGDGTIQRVEFFITLEDKSGQVKEFTRNNKGFWTRLQELDIQEGDKVSIVRVGKDRDARYSISKEE